MVLRPLRAAAVAAGGKPLRPLKGELLQSLW